MDTDTLMDTDTFMNSHKHGHIYTVTLMDTLRHMDTILDAHLWTHIHGYTNWWTKCSHRHAHGHTLVDTAPALTRPACLSLETPASGLRLDRQTDPSPEEQVMDWLGIFLGPVAPKAFSVPPSQAQLVRRMWSARSQSHRGCL